MRVCGAACNFVTETGIAVWVGSNRISYDMTDRTVVGLWWGGLWVACNIDDGKLWNYSFAGNSTILHCSCNKEATFYLTINVFWSQQHIVQRKSFFLYACSQEIFTKNVYPQRGNAIPHNTDRNIIIIANAKQLSNQCKFKYSKINNIIHFLCNHEYPG